MIGSKKRPPKADVTDIIDNILRGNVSQKEKDITNKGRFAKK